MTFSRFALLASCLCLLSFSPPSAAQTGIPGGDAASRDGAAATSSPQTISGDDAEAIRAIAEGYGEAEVVELDNGDPAIAGDINGASYQIFFLGCTEGRDCTSLNFYAIWDVPTVSVAALNGWNRTAPFNKAYLTENNLPVIEMNLPTAGGFPRAQLAFIFDQWTIALADFPRSVLFAQP